MHEYFLPGRHVDRKWMRSAWMLKSHHDTSIPVDSLQPTRQKGGSSSCQRSRGKKAAKTSSGSCGTKALLWRHAALGPGWASYAGRHM